MNRFKKFAENVFVAECDEEYKKNDIIELQTKYGKVVVCKVWNLIKKTEEKYYYSIERVDGVNSKTIAEKRAKRYKNTKENKIIESEKWFNKAQEGSDFLTLSEPIKVGHHSEHRHRALIERNYKRMENSCKFMNEAEKYNNKIEYWESKANEINLSMPECLEFYEYQLINAIDHHNGLKDGSIKREHGYSLQYSNKKVKDLKRKVEIANALWGLNES